ncbi:hypothetical protein KKC97_13680 [bacterium]|nr:hypothetical protein [bacterium]MBU1638708.1 hypothetical protein [bacterium]
MDNKTSTTRRISLKLEGPSVKNGRVPINVLASKLDALQTSLYNVASTKRKGGKRGNWSSHIRRSCELLFVETKLGSLEVITELAPADEFEEEGIDLGLDSIQLYRRLLESVTRNDTEALIGDFPDSGARARVLNSLKKVLPNEEDEYNVRIGLNGSKAQYEMSARNRDFLNKCVTLCEDEIIDEESIRTVTGRLFRIEIETATRNIGLDVANRQIRCRYPDSLEQTISQFITGSLVEVTGRVSLDTQDNIVEITEILHIDDIQPRPIIMTQIKLDHRALVFKNPITVDLDFRNSLWIHEYEPLGILSYASTRRQSLDFFREEFLVLWDEIANCDDSELTYDAVDLKKRIKSIVTERGE